MGLYKIIKLLHRKKQKQTTTKINKMKSKYDDEV